ncbi:hypothetical protein [Bacillus phage SPO1L3]|nr:hypothetical protein [Bacillus phage SPO1L3]
MIVDVKGYEGLYKISEQGYIFSEKKESPLKPYRINSGYLVVKLTKNGKRKAFQVHRLVALHFCEGYAEGLVVDHIDGDKNNNHCSNLRWVTQKANARNQKARGTLNVSIAQQVAKIKNQKPITVISPEGDTFAYESTKKASLDLKLSASKITDVLRGRRTHHKGYAFTYSDTNG